MRTIKNLIRNEKKVYIVLSDDEIRKKFMEDAQREGITFSDNVKPTQRKAQDIMALLEDGTICFLGFAGRMCYKHSTDKVIRIDYKKYVQNEDDCFILNP